MSEYTIAKGKTYFEAKQYAKKGIGSWFSKLGNSLVAVVVVLPVAGLFAAIGGILISHAQTLNASGDIVKWNEAMMTSGLILSDLGQTVLSNLGLLFMLAILLGFTDRKGYALFSAIIGYIAFVGFITPFIRYEPVKLADGSLDFDPAHAQYFHIWFWKKMDSAGNGLETKTQLTNIFGLGQQAWSMDGKELKPGTFTRLSYEGFTTLNTGVLGGIVLGFVYVWIYNHGKDLKLPKMLAFFSGEKFSSVVALCLTPVIASLFIIIWPGVNWVLERIGIGLTTLPYGIDAGIFGVLKQLLIPFEAHQALIAPLWYTAAGGVLSQAQPDVIAAMMYRIAHAGATAGIGKEANYIHDTVMPWAQGIKAGNESLWTWINSTFTGYNYKAADFASFSKFQNVTGISTFWNEINNGMTEYGNLNWKVQGDQLMTMEVLNNHPSVDIRDFWSANLKITRFITGGYANLMFLTPTVGVAMWSILSKDQRKRKMGFYIGAALPSFLLGVNEPIIFLFAYTAPLIYYVAYSGICGVLFLFTALFQAKLSSTFSQGLLDYVVNGIIPTVTRQGQAIGASTDATLGAQQTMLWVPLVIGAITFVLGFVFFRWLFIKQEFVAPGMEEDKIDSDIKGQSVYTKTKPLVIGLTDYFGGVHNIKSIEWKDGDTLKVEPKETFEYKKTVFSVAMFDQIIVNKDNSVEMVMSRKNYDFVRAVNYVATLVQVDNSKKIKRTEKIKLHEKLAKIAAKWQIKHDSLDTTTDIEKATAEYKEQVWALVHPQRRELLKAEGKEVKPLTKQIKAEVKQLTKDYKKEIKVLKAENKAKIKAERSDGKKKAKTKTLKTK